MYEMSQRHPVWVAENHVKPCNSVCYVAHVCIWHLLPVFSARARSDYEQPVKNMLEIAPPNEYGEYCNTLKTRSAHQKVESYLHMYNYNIKLSIPRGFPFSKDLPPLLKLM